MGVGVWRLNHGLEHCRDYTEQLIVWVNIIYLQPAYPSLTGPRLSMGAIYEGDGGVEGP